MQANPLQAHLQTTKPYIPSEHAAYTNHSRISKRYNRLSPFCHICVSPSSTLLVLSNQLLDSLDVLILGILGAQILVLSPLCVLRLALRTEIRRRRGCVQKEVEYRNVP